MANIEWIKQNDPATYAALLQIEQLGNRPNPVRERIEADARIAFLRNQLAACKLPLADGTLGGMTVFADFMSSRYQREARVRKLMQVRRWQIEGLDTRNRRIEYLMLAADCRLVEKRIVSAELNRRLEQRGAA